jgi:putative addiction module component (TIGR02574 family)
MASKVPNPPHGFDDLSVEEKLDYVQSLWDRIAAKPEAIPVPDWHIDLIEQRLRRNRVGRGRTWTEIRNELQDRLRQS